MDESFYRNVLDNLMDGVYFVDTDRRITYWNRGAERITGYYRQEVMGRPCHDNILNHVDTTGECLCQGKCPLAFSLEDGKTRKTDLFLQNKSGERVPVSIKIAPIWEDGRIVGAVESFSDSSAKLAALERVEKLMEENLTDPLTKVGNRRYTEMTLHNRFDEIKRYNWNFGLLFLDIDHFKRVNDNFGHAAGDIALRAVAENLSRNLRSSDFVGRWGGEEFVILLVNVNNQEELIEAADRFRRLIASSKVPYQGRQISVSVSIGATISREDDDFDSILNRADRLLYQAKHLGRNRVESVLKEAEGSAGKDR